MCSQMNPLPQQFTNEQTGISYTLDENGNYYYPDLTMPEEPEYDIGIFGLMRRNYLKNHRKGLFTALLTTGKLNEHLYEIDQAANDRMELMTKQIAKTEGVTEQLKADDMMDWVRRMTNIQNRIREIINEELIYN